MKEYRLTLNIKIQSETDVEAIVKSCETIAQMRIDGIESENYLLEEDGVDICTDCMIEEESDRQFKLLTEQNIENAFKYTK